MDPNANLARQLEVVAEIERLEEDNEDGDNDQLLADYGSELADLVKALHGWLSKQGALPSAWVRQ